MKHIQTFESFLNEGSSSLEPVKITIAHGTVFKNKGIKAKDYYERGYVQYQYEVIVVMDNGQAMKGQSMYKSEDQVGSNAVRTSGKELVKQKEFLKRYEKAIDDANGGISPQHWSYSGSFVSLVVFGGVDLGVNDTKSQAEADDVIKKKMVPALKKEFPKVEIDF